MELHAHARVRHLDGRSHWRIRAHVDALTHHGRPLARDRPASFALVGATDLAPLAGPVDVALLLLEELLIVERVEQLWIRDTGIVPGEGRGRLGPQDLHLQTFLGKEPVVLSDEP